MKTAMTPANTLTAALQLPKMATAVTAAQPAAAATIARRIRADTMRVASKNDGADGDTAAA